MEGMVYKYDSAIKPNVSSVGGLSLAPTQDTEMRRLSQKWYSQFYDAMIALTIFILFLE